MGVRSLAFAWLVVSGTIVEAYPGKKGVDSSKATHSSTSHHPISDKAPTHTKSATHISSAPATPNASAYSAEIAQALAENPGPATTLDAVQQQANKQESAIAAQGSALEVAGISSVRAAATAAPDCNDGSWDLTVANWNKYKTDQNLRTWWFGGKDTDGITYAPKKADQSSALAEGLATSFLPEGASNTYACTLESNGCPTSFTCDEYNVHLQGVKQVGIAQYFTDSGPPSHWGWFATHAITNVATFAHSFANAFTNAAIGESFLLLDTTNTFTQPTQNPDIVTRDILLGFSFVLAAAFSFVPLIGPVIGVAAAGLLSAAGSTAAAALGDSAGFLGITLQAKTVTLDVKASALGSYMATVFNSTYAAIDDMVIDLMGGYAINQPSTSSPTLLDILAGGDWVTGAQLSSGPTISDIQTVLQKDLLQRAINQLWGHTKTYVTFVNLNDDAAGTKCQADKNGWQASKTCLDGGVYYLYFFHEGSGSETGWLDYPWGANQMADPTWGLQPNWVTQSSRSSYRSSSNPTGFAYDYTKAPTNLPNILKAVGQDHSLDNLNALEGVWNISVCDMGNHSDWNGDFTTVTNSLIKTTNADYNNGNINYFFPCCCGPQCTQTAAFVQSAQMNNFQTIYDSCKVQLQECSAWPEGVTEIDYGQAGTITKDVGAGGVSGQCVNTLNVPGVADSLSPGD